MLVLEIPSADIAKDIAVGVLMLVLKVIADITIDISIGVLVLVLK